MNDTHPPYSYAMRPAETHDAEAITGIYNAAIEAGGSSADTTPRTVAQRLAWIEGHEDPYQVFVIEARGADGEALGTVGFCALEEFYGRAGYNGVADVAYYVDPAWRRRGVGSFALAGLIDEARLRGMRKLVGIIFATNQGSIALMERFGFRRFGLLPDAATDSTGMMRDMSYWYRDIA